MSLTTSDVSFVGWCFELAVKGIACTARGLSGLLSSNRTRMLMSWDGEEYGLCDPHRSE